VDFQKNRSNASSRRNPTTYHFVKIKQKEIDNYEENYSILSKC